MDTFLDIVTLTKVRCNIADIDDYDEIIKNGINQAYMELRRRVPYVVTTILIPVEGIATLPDDCQDVLSINPMPVTGFYVKGSNLFAETEESLTLTYTTVPEPLINDTDVPELPKKYWYGISSYGCYSYYLFKKKTDMSQAYYQAYVSNIASIDSMDVTSSIIGNVYANLTGGDW